MTNRAERRRAEREAKKHPLGRPPSDQRVQLVNPMAQMYEQFIFGNSLHCDRTAQQNSLEGQHVVICGAGPSLADHAAEWCPQGDQVWGVNSALTYLLDRGHRVTHAFTVDQQPAMCQEWATTPDVEYYLASTVHPHLTELLVANGRRITWFHNFVGIKKPPVAFAVCNACEAVTDHNAALCPTCEGTDLDARTLDYEDWMYSTLYPATCRTGSGLNSVNRAIDLAIYLGARVTVLGADCALRLKKPFPKGVAKGSPEHMKWLDECVVMHADGGSALASGASALTLGGMIDGRWWESKPDMMISAVWLVKMAQFYGHDRVQLIGDTLPNAIRDKTDEFLLQLPTMVDAQGNPIPIVFYEGHIGNLAGVASSR